MQTRAPNLDRGERHQRRLVERAVARGNRRAVRIGRRLADRGRHAIDQLVRRGVLQALRFVVHEIPGIAERRREIGFDDAVAAERAQRGAAAGLCQAHAAIGSCAISPCSASRRTMPLTDAGATPQRRGDLVRAGDAVACAASSSKIALR